ncbi:MAG: hypothetical protein PHP30_00220 [Bacteroidales bacterium]|nr:hypothetical protein [Bacteroidales bacterium]MDD3988508.1 hypothetical protein [Bacteroidales bacterium]
MIRNSSNPIEQKMAGMIEEHFPYYDKFWDDFLIDGIGNDNHWKDGPLERLGIATYGILKSLNFIRINYDKIKVNDENQTFKNIYFHFGIICELIPYCCRFAYDFLKTLGLYLSNINFKSDKIENEEMIKILKVFITDKNVFDELRLFYEQITTYRHFYTHNPGIDIVNNGGMMRVVKRKLINNCKELSSIRKLDSLDSDNFVNPISQVYTDLMDMLKYLNIIWMSLYDKMKNGKTVFLDRYLKMTK